MVAANVTRPEGEADLLVVDRAGHLILVEVKTVLAGGDPFVRIDHHKERVLVGLASALGAARIDVVGVVVDGAGVAIHADHGW